MTNKSEILIIGGGINGVSTAYHLAKHGVQVTLIEKNYLGGGPSGLSSAIIRQHYSNPVTARMAYESLSVWANFTEIAGGKPVFTKTGFLVCVRPEDTAGLQENLAMQKSLGIDTRFVTTREIVELEPQLDIGNIGGGAYEPDSGYCDPVEAINGLAEGAKRYGARILSGVEVREIVIEKGRATGVTTSQGTIHGDMVIAITGPWSTRLFGKIGIRLPIHTARVKVVLYRRPSSLPDHTIVADFVSQIYLRPETGGLMLVGSISPDEETSDRVVDPDHFNDKVDLETIASFAERAAERYQAMLDSHVASSYASLYDLTPDWHPIMDAIPGIEGLYLCAGSSGHGFKLAPAVGKMMAKLVLEGKQPDDDINLFAFNRYEQGHPVKGQYEYSILG